MKLAEALMLRADQKKKLFSLRERIARNVRAQEGEEPAESANDLLVQAFALLREQQSTVLQIDRANAGGQLADGRPLATALAERETIKQEHALLVAAIAAAQKDADRYSPREIKWVTLIDVKAAQRQADDLSAKLRNLNVQIQQANWHIDV